MQKYILLSALIGAFAACDGSDSSKDKPRADAGPAQSVARGRLVKLDGSGSKGASGALRYAWAQTGGETVQLSGNDTYAPEFISPNTPGVLTFTLLVEEGGQFSSPDTVSVTVTNNAPTARAGSDRNAARGAVVILSAVTSDDADDDDVLSYLWEQTAGDTVTLNGPDEVNADFIAPSVSGVLVFQLTVNDGVETSTDSVAITVTNVAPSVDAGPSISIVAGDTIELAGTAEDLDGDALTFAWTQVSGDSVTLSDATVLNPTFTAPAGQTDLVFELEASDGEATSTDQVTLTVVVPAQPTAVAGDDVDTEAFGLVHLDGSASSDPGSLPLTYAWTQTAGPTVSLDDSTSASPSFLAPKAGGTLTFSLTVNNGDVSSPPDSVDVVVDGYSGTRVALAQNVFSPHVAVSSGEAWGVSVAGNLLASANYEGGLDLIDISNPWEPRVLSNFSTGPSSATRVLLQANKAYVVADNKMFIVDVSDPELPTSLGVYTDTEFLLSVVVDGNYAYLANVGEGLQIVDISNPASPQAVGQYDPGFGWSADAEGSLAVVCDGSGLRTADVSNPASPTGVGFLDTTNSVGVDLVGNLAYVADTVDGLLIVDVSTPATPALLGSYAGNFQGVHVDGNRAYLVACGAGVVVVDVGTSASPSLVETLPMANDCIQDVTVAGGFVFAADRADGSTYRRLGMPSAPAYVGSVNPGYVDHVQAAEPWVYAGAGTDGAFVLDVQTASAPSVEGSYDTAGFAGDVLSADDTVYVADGTAGVSVLNVSTPSAPTLAGSYNTSGVARQLLAGEGSTLYVADAGGGVVVLDTSTASPTLVSAYDTPNSALAIASMGQRLFVSDTSSIIALDPADRASLTLLDSTAVVGTAGDIAAAHGYVYYSDLTQGFVVLDGDTLDPLATFGDLQYFSGLRVEANGPHMVLGTDSGVVRMHVGDPSAPVLDAWLDSGPVSDVALGVDSMYVAAGADGMVVLPKPQDLISLDANNVSVTTGSTVQYQATWLDRYPAFDEELSCHVTCGTCAISAVDQVQHHAQVSWTLPGTSEDCEIAVAVGNATYWAGARDQVRVGTP